jgi:hypothetical protein
MIECRACRGLFRAPADKIGARCPRCRMPLFDRGERAVKEAELGVCIQHTGAAALARCHQCRQAICGVCRTRWFGANLCPACFEAALASDEPNPKELNRLGARAAWSFALALTAWIIVACAVLVLLAMRANSGVTLGLVLAVFSLLPAVFAVGQGCAVVLMRGPRSTLAATGMTLAAAHLGLFVGVLFLNLWHN